MINSGMRSMIKEIIEGKTKTRVSVTIDLELLNKIEDYKKKNKIEKLSPTINEMLWDWIKKEEQRNK